MLQEATRRSKSDSRLTVLESVRFMADGMNVLQMLQQNTSTVLEELAAGRLKSLQKMMEQIQNAVLTLLKSWQHSTRLILFLVHYSHML